MTKNYTTIRTEKLIILGHKVKAIIERFSDEYLDSERFKSRCLRYCFYTERESYSEPCICDYIRCNGYSRDIQIHFELIDGGK
jgi:hypothetical protein